MINFPKTLDNTIVSAWSKCQRSAFYAHFMHLTPKHLSIHLKGGAAYAAALEEFRLAFYDERKDTYHDTEACLPLGLRRLFTEFGYDPDYDESLGEGHVKQAWCFAEMYARHFKAYAPKTDLVQPWLMNDGTPAVEQSFSLPMDLKHPDTGEDIIFHGRYDMLASYYGEPWVFDDKTCQQLGATWAKQWDTRSQFTGYCYGAREYGIPVKGALVRGHCFLKNDVKFDQAISSREGWQLDQWWEDLHRIVYEMIGYYNMAKDRMTSSMEHDLAIAKHPNPIILFRDGFPAKGIFTEACNAYGGCDFGELCSSKFPERWLSHYRKRVWDPTNPSDD